ncbi:fatty acid--CoA ligase family protein [Methylobacterium sp. B4]|uniref:class I adenylate-forming enzyme family protein n=1 Tax=Methylobacterium sp. B4 TaxID=1938755 RepID=UPI000D75DDB1|nr:fatty acid--CoA ligase family protein [Methylobacterium sp. B4]PXW64156.1 acyl-CoA synthetase (AMP-forming)/AMP-acid ligase II [Methylobacterium sp. B4]
MILRERLLAAGGLDGLFLSDHRTQRDLAGIVAGGRDAAVAEALAGRRVLLAVGGQMAAARAMIALDGLAARLALVPPKLAPEHVARIAQDAEAEICVCDAEGLAPDALPGLPRIDVEDACRAAPDSARETEWALATSGTTGAPKLVAHTLEGLAGGINTAAAPEPGTVWSTFYDIRRYGGLQVFLRAMLGPSSLVLSEAGEPLRDYLIRVGEAGVSHILGTPSHWRLALMSAALDRLAPRYVRLSGEIADQTVLDALRAAFPDARIAHAYASTEGGVGFTVEDGREGFPSSLIGTRAGIEIAVRDDSLFVRSGRTGRRYLGAAPEALIAGDGFIDTGDLVERRGERYHFLGRRSGVINVGGAKVQPEEVETVINVFPGVSMSRVRARANPILGAVVEAEIVLRADAEIDRAELKRAILAHCRPRLAAHKVPASVKFVDALPITSGGKLVRRGA